MNFISPTLSWAIVGLIFITLEVFTTTFVLLFFGVAAFITALLCWMFDLNLAFQFITFAVVGLSGMLIFRKKVLATFHKTPPYRMDQQQKITLEVDILPHSESRVFYQGTSWLAKNDSDETLAQGSTVLIAGTEGVKLILKKPHL